MFAGSNNTLIRTLSGQVEHVSVMSLDNTMTLELKTMEYFTLFDIKFYECMLFHRFKIYVFLPKICVVEMPLS